LLGQDWVPSFGTALIFSLYWEKTNKYGVLGGMLTGTMVTILWKLFLVDPTGIYELIPALICSSLTIVVISLVREKG